MALPMNHAFGLNILIVLCWKYAGTTILQERFEPLTALRDIEKYRRTFCPMVPTMYLMILAAPELSSYDTTSVRTWLSDSAPFPVEKIREVENAFFKHPSIAEACVIGLPDTKYGEDVYASVVLRPGCEATEKDILEEVQKHIAKFKCPKKIWLWPELPKTRTGKSDKQSIREKALKEISFSPTPPTLRGG
jgi:acyl-CoA synthetase (AMP-forming)/AMP-acid ligase II